MRRTTKKTPTEIPGLFKLVLAALCLAGSIGLARFVSVGVKPGEEKTEDAFSPEAPASYLSSPIAFDDCATYLDGRGRRFGESSSVEPVVVTASHNANQETAEDESGKEPKDEELFAVDFVDDTEDDDAEETFDESSESIAARTKLNSKPLAFASDFPQDGWSADELKRDFKDYRLEWDKFDKERKNEIAFDGADFVDQNHFEKSLVTDDFFFSGATTALIGQTKAAQGESGQISQVSAETSVKSRRWRRSVPRGAVGGFGVDEVLIR